MVGVFDPISMSSRGRRGRGRPPKIPLSSRNENRSNFLKKPKYLVSGSGVRAQAQTRGSSQGSSANEYRREFRGRQREAAQRGRNFNHRVADSDDDEDDEQEDDDEELRQQRRPNHQRKTRLSSESDFQDDESAKDSDVSFDSDELSDYSVSSYSTAGSSTQSKQRKYFRRALSPCPTWLQDREVPPLTLPKSSEDLLLRKDRILLALSIYEVLRRFRHAVRLSTFRFEDFCAAVASDEQSALLAETHMVLLKAILREDESNNTWYGSHDQKDSVNIQFYLADAMTWPEVMRCFLESDPEFHEVLCAFDDGEYPFTNVVNKLKVLKFLCDIFLTTNHVREEILAEGAIQYDDHCRVCHRLGDLLCCETCPAVYHLACVDPPLEEVPEEDWVCNVCRAQQVQGVTDCISDMERSGLLCRQEILGYDRHGRKYWFLCRRVFVENDDGELWYYTTKPQLQELLEVLDPQDLEADLCRTIEDLKEDITRQMELTEKLTNLARGNKKSYLDVENANVLKAQSERAMQKAREEMERQAMLKRETEDPAQNGSDSAVETGAGDAQESRKEAAADGGNNNVVAGDVSAAIATPATTTVTTSTTTALSSTEAAGSMSTAEDASAEKCNQDNKDCNSEDKETPAADFFHNMDDSDSEKAEGGSGEGDAAGRQKGGRSGIVTRSKTGSLQPRTFSIEDLRTRAAVAALSARKDGSDRDSDSVLVINKDGEISRVTRSKANSMAGSNFGAGGPFLFKLGCDCNYKTYSNQYATNTLALNKPQHNEERDKKRHLSHKFSLTPASEFKWNGATYGNRALTVNTLRQTILQMESNVPTAFLHPNWHLHRGNWLKAVNKCNAPADFALAISILECCMKQVLFNPVWGESLGATGVVGHIRMQRNTVLVREDRKKEEKREKKEAEDHVDRTLWVKYPLGLRHQVWKQKGEEYRITGQNGWVWMSCTKVYHDQPSAKMGLKGGPHKIVVTLRGAPGNPKAVLAQGSEENPTDDGAVPMDVDDKSALNKTTEEAAKNNNNAKLNSNDETSAGKQVGVIPVLPPTELVDVSAGLSSPLRVVYPKIARVSKLDSFLERRIQLKELQEKMLPSLDKVKSENLLNEKPQVDSVKKECLPDVKPVVPNGDIADCNDVKFQKCYSSSCDGSSDCYSPMCRVAVAKKLSVPKPDVSQAGVVNPSCVNGDDMEVDVEGDRKIEDKVTVDNDKERQLSGDVTVSNGDDISEEALVKPVPFNAAAIVHRAKKEIVKVENVDNAKKSILDSTSGRTYLAKITKVTKQKKKPGRGVLPTSGRFTTKSNKQSLLVLPRHELRRLARRGGNREVSGFSSSAKPNPQVWPYPCPRPVFRTCWRYRTCSVRSIHAAALQLRVLWACLRWDDMAMKPPPGGTNTLTSETEVTTCELLKRRDVGLFGLRSEYLVRRIIVPIDLPSKPREKTTPQRSGLRERRRPESPMTRGPSVTEVWVPEEELELWEIKSFGEKVEKQQQAIRDKIAQQSAQQIKAQMEAQLKLQRQAIQQKRLLEQAKAITTSATTVITTTTATTTTVSKVLTPGVSTAKTLSINTPTVFSTPTGAKTYGGVRRIFTTKGLRIAPATGNSPAANTGSTAASLVTPGKIPIAATILPKTTQTFTPFVPRAASTTVAGTNATTPRPAVVTVRSLAPPAGIAGQSPRPAVVQTSTPGVTASPTTPVRTQIQIIQGPNGQLQVRGLLPGQQLVRLTDGRLQLITMPAVQANAAAAAQQTIQIATMRAPMATTASPAVTTGTVTTSATPVMPTLQLVATSSPSTGAVTSSVVPTATVATISTPQGPKIVQIRPQIMPGSVQAQPHVVQTQVKAGKNIIQVQHSPLQPKILQPVATVVTPQSPTVGLPAVTTRPLMVTPQPPAPTMPSSPVQVQTTQLLTTSSVLTPVTSPLANAVLTPPTAGSTTVLSPTVPAQKFVLTPQITQQIIRQALVSPNTTPEIQAKLLALQRHQQQQMQQQKLKEVVQLTGSGSSGASSQSSSMTSVSVASAPSKTLKIASPNAAIQGLHLDGKNKQKTLTSEQKEDNQRLTVCQQVLRGILDRIEKEERAHLRKQKQKEDAEERRNRASTNKLQALLFKHKELVKKDILKKRALLDKELQAEIQDELKHEVVKIQKPLVIQTPVQEKAKKSNKRKSHSSGSDGSVILHHTPPIVVKPVSAPVNHKPSSRPVPAASAASMFTVNPPRPKKQKTISTGSASSAISTMGGSFGGNSLGSGSRSHKDRKVYCICKTPYDQKRFYIGCDLCSNWFHGECVNVSEDQAKQMAEYVCEDCRKSKGSQELYCLCRQPYDESQFYICCDRCQDWFHGRCVGILQSEADAIEEYTCPNCQGNTRINHANLRPLAGKDFENLKRLLRSLQSHKMAWPFLEPVDPNDVPDYYKIIKEPMDLQTVELRVNEHSYERLSDFIGDMTKIFDNCRYYNARDSPFYRCAEALEAFFVQRIKAFRDKLS